MNPTADPPSQPPAGRPAAAAGAPHAALADRRVGYDVGSLEPADLSDIPLAQFRRWFDDAVAAGVIEPNAMVLATVGRDGVPSARTVLLKQADPRGFVFFTNYASRKAAELGRREGAALVFGWVPMHRQVCVRGLAERVPADETAGYFRTRPWGSRIGAWTSHQSQVLLDRRPLDARFADLAARWPDTGSPQDVPVPPHWGGFVVRAFEVEFWQGRPSRLHDRLVFVTVADRPAPLDDARGWRLERREP